MNISRKHRLHLYTMCHHYNFRLGLDGIIGRSEEMYVSAEHNSRCRKTHKMARKAFKDAKKGGYLDGRLPF